MKPVFINNIFVFLVIAFCLFGLNACKKDEPNPCNGLKPTSANFFTYEKLTPIIYEKTDSFALYYGVWNGYSPKFVVFKAEDSTANSYEWRIGDDSRFLTGSIVGLVFKGNIGRIPITLITTKESDKSCFPNDDGKDTVVKLVTFFNSDPPRIAGKYRGVTNKNLNDTFSVDLSYAPIEYNKKEDVVIDVLFKSSYSIKIRGLNRFSKYLFSSGYAATNYFYAEYCDNSLSEYPHLYDLNQNIEERLSDVLCKVTQNKIIITYKSTSYNLSQKLEHQWIRGEKLTNLETKTFTGNRIQSNTK